MDLIPMTAALLSWVIGDVDMVAVLSTSKAVFWIVFS